MNRGIENCERASERNADLICIYNVLTCYIAIAVCAPNDSRRIAITATIYRRFKAQSLAADHRTFFPGVRLSNAIANNGRTRSPTFEQRNVAPNKRPTNMPPFVCVINDQTSSRVPREKEGGGGGRMSTLSARGNSARKRNYVAETRWISDRVGLGRA